MGISHGAGGGEFERERHPVERAAQRDDRVVVGIECGTRRGGAVPRRAAPRRPSSSGSTITTCSPVTPKGSRLVMTTRTSSPACNSRRYEAGDGVEHVFTVVEHDDSRACSASAAAAAATDT